MDNNTWLSSLCLTDYGTVKDGSKCANDMLTAETINSIAEQNKPHGMNIGFAEEIFLQLGMSNEKVQKWNQNMDNLEAKGASYNQCQCDSISPLETSSISNTKDELSFATETISASSELSQDEMNSNDYPEEIRKADCGSSLLCLDALEEFSQNLDLSSFSGTFSCDSDSEESIMKDDVFNSDKQAGDAAGEEKANKPKQDELKNGPQELSTTITENSQIQQQHDSVAKQLDHVKALMQANQLLTEGLRTKLLQIWCQMPKNEVRTFQEDEISEVDSESLLVFPGEESSLASVCEDDHNLATEQQSSLLTAPIENAKCETASGPSETCHSRCNVNCLNNYVQTVKPQEGSMCLEERVPDLEKHSEQHNEALRTPVSSLKCDHSEVELVGKSPPQKDRMIISLKDLEGAAEEMHQYNQKILLAKDAIEDTAQTVKVRLQKIQWQLMELEAANRSLHLQIGKLNADYSQIQEHHQCVVCENKSLADQCVDLQANLNSTAAENEQMLIVIAKLEKRIEAALVNLTEISTEKNKLEQQVQSLKEEYKRHEEARIAEREQINKNYSKLVDEIEVLRVRTEKEHCNTLNLKQEISAVRSENHRLQQVAEEETKKKRLAELDAKRWKKEFDILAAEQQEKDMKLVHSDLSTKKPSEKGDCANSVCVRRTSQILSKIDVILSSMEGIIICRESNSRSNGIPPGEDTGHKENIDLKEKAPETNNNIKHSKQEECAAVDLKVRDSLGSPTSSHRTSKNEMVQKRIVKKNEECKILAAENVKLHKCVKELTCKVNGFNKIIQFADQRLQMNNLHILRLEKKNSILLAALNKRPRKNEARGSSPDSTSGSSHASGRTYRFRAEQNNHNTPDVCDAQDMMQHLKMCNKQNEKHSQGADNPESEDCISRRHHLGSTSQPDIYSVCNKKDELYLETDTIGTTSEISQDDVNDTNNAERDEMVCNASYCDPDIGKSVPQEDTSDKKTAIECEDEDVNTHKPIPGEGNKHTEDYHQTKAVTSCKQKQDQAVKSKYKRGKSTEELKLLATENIRLHTCVNELQYKVDGLNKIVQFADQRLRMFNLQILRLEKKNSALLAALNKKSRKNTES
ncbi:cancer-associated gene 1 protein homolog isoform X2 [Scyliorhinus canicula]|uniref:cancer-associated gene 1 protein homolog isoform X2 n=1 Tax=Scyliorhinus canicula TaxID=7830 RepID=UPI0018F51E94|nr:cancer-associated gene 1 protein homolog isoform X2 [Scyliorhinus canicula]